MNLRLHQSTILRAVSAFVVAVPRIVSASSDGCKTGYAGNTWHYDGSGMNPQNGVGTGWYKLSDGWESDPVNIVTNWDISSESDDPCFVVGLVDTSIYLYDCLNPSWTLIHGPSTMGEGFGDTNLLAFQTKITSLESDSSQLSVQVILGLQNGAIAYYRGTTCGPECISADAGFDWITLNENSNGNCCLWTDDLSDDSSFVEVQWPDENSFYTGLRVVVGVNEVKKNLEGALVDTSTVWFNNDALDGGDWNNLGTLYDNTITAMKVAFNGQDSLPAIVVAYQSSQIAYYNSEYLGGEWLAVNNDASLSTEVVNIEVQFPWENTVSHLKVVAALSKGNTSPTGYVNYYYAYSGQYTTSLSVTTWSSYNDIAVLPVVGGLCVNFPTDSYEFTKGSEMVILAGYSSSTAANMQEMSGYVYVYYDSTEDNQNAGSIPGIGCDMPGTVAPCYKNAAVAGVVGMECSWENYPTSQNPYQIPEMVLSYNNASGAYWNPANPNTYGLQSGNFTSLASPTW